MKKIEKLTISGLLYLAETKELVKRKVPYIDLFSGEIKYIVLGAKAWRKFFNEFGEGGINFMKYDGAFPEYAAEMSVEEGHKAFIVVDFFGEHLYNYNEIIIISDDFVIREKFNKREVQCLQK